MRSFGPLFFAQLSRLLGMGLGIASHCCDDGDSDQFGFNTGSFCSEIK
jgi:hypothetical protein